MREADSGPGGREPQALLQLRVPQPGSVSPCCLRPRGQGARSHSWRAGTCGVKGTPHNDCQSAEAPLSCALAVPLAQNPTGVLRARPRESPFGDSADISRSLSPLQGQALVTKKDSSRARRHTVFRIFVFKGCQKKKGANPGISVLTQHQEPPPAPWAQLFALVLPGPALF